MRERRNRQNRKLPQGLKPVSFEAFYGTDGMAEQAAEKGTKVVTLGVFCINVRS